MSGSISIDRNAPAAFSTSPLQKKAGQTRPKGPWAPPASIARACSAAPKPYQTGNALSSVANSRRKILVSASSVARQDTSAARPCLSAAKNVPRSAGIRLLPGTT
eukprot:scaffold23591_cov15-Prasinocladus_malaysianus.AAC.1